MLKLASISTTAFSILLKKGQNNHTLMCINPRGNRFCSSSNVGIHFSSLPNCTPIRPQLWTFELVCRQTSSYSSTPFFPTVGPQGSLTLLGIIELLHHVGNTEPVGGLVKQDTVQSSHRHPLLSFYMSDSLSASVFCGNKAQYPLYQRWLVH